MDPKTDPYNRPPDSLRIVVPFIPPSSNKIYVIDWRRKRRFRSEEANAFINRFMQEVVPNYLPWISQMLGPEQDPTVIYTISSNFYFTKWAVLNKSWGAAKNPAKTRYKKMDTGNRFKLMHDCVSRALAIDDSHFFGVGGNKLVAEAFGLTPQVHIFLTRQRPADLGV